MNQAWVEVVAFPLNAAWAYRNPEDKTLFFVIKYNPVTQMYEVHDALSKVGGHRTLEYAEVIGEALHSVL
jgi:hypothetical protein